MILGDESRMIFQKVSLFVTSTSDDPEANFPRQYHSIPKSNMPLREQSNS